MLSEPTTSWLPGEKPVIEKPKNHYDILGVSQGASSKAIRLAYKRRSFETIAERRRAEIAFSILSNFIKREAYDRELAQDVTVATSPRAGLMRRIVVQAILLPATPLLIAFWPFLAPLGGARASTPSHAPAIS